jgi:hypothetical protein
MIYNSNKYADTLMQFVEMVSKRLSNCERFQKVRDYVTLIPLEELSDFNVARHRFIEDDGIAYVHTVSESRMNFIILDMRICRKVALTEVEMEAAIMHELGHILNEYPKRPVPKSIDHFRIHKTMEGFSDAEGKLIEKENRENNEFFADAYANFHGCARELISSMKKYLALDFAQNKALFELRKERLESGMKPILSGKIKEFNSPR